ncbi:MAG: hypothetical protein GEU98_21800 [Pseudonocardiaceae bacterium]|nr:hypothetical protein [Pseudonocardiaceae bacterium]
MTTTASEEARITRNDTFLRNVLKLDAAATVPAGILLAALAGMLDSVLGLPAGLLLGVGGFCVLYGVAVFFVATRSVLARPAVLAMIAINLVWVLDSALMLTVGWFDITTAGTVVIIGLAAAVGGLAALQAYGLRR